MPGSLTIVGLGPARPEHVTLEAREVLREAAASGARVYGLAHARALARAVEPELEVRALDYLYALKGVDRPTAYRDLAGLLLRRAFEDALHVVYLVAGSPLFINDAVLLVRRLCAERRLPLRLVHGLSFLDLVLDRVFWTGHQGLQLYSAWNVARDGIALNPGVPGLLCQLGEFTAGTEALQTGGSTAMLAELSRALAATHGANHPVVVLYSSGEPDYRSLARPTTVGRLAEEPVPVYANLWVPAVDGPELETRVAPESR